MVEVLIDLGPRIATEVFRELKSRDGKTRAEVKFHVRRIHYRFSWWSSRSKWIRNVEHQDHFVRLGKRVIKVIFRVPSEANRIELVHRRDFVNDMGPPDT